MSGTLQPFVAIAPSPFEWGAASHVGKVRTRNEDSYLVDPDSGVWAVADGMGGHNDGDVASKTVVEALQAIGRRASAADLLTSCEFALIDANTRIREIAAQRGGAVIGTTVAMLLTFESHYACVWSGDSRVYLLREGVLTQISRDHTEVQELLAEGLLTPEEAKKWPGRNVITRAIGVYDQPEVEMEQGALQPDDVFLICSDGLTGHISDEAIQSGLIGQTCQSACDALVALTLKDGARDNVTVVALRYHPNNDAVKEGGEPAAQRPPVESTAVPGVTEGAMEAES